MIFPTGRHLWQDVDLATPSATLRKNQGEALNPHAMGYTAFACFGRTSWIDSQGAEQARPLKELNEIFLTVYGLPK